MRGRRQAEGEVECISWLFEASGSSWTLASNLAASTQPPGPRVTHDQQQNNRCFIMTCTCEKGHEFQHFHVFLFDNICQISAMILQKHFHQQLDIFLRAAETDHRIFIRALVFPVAYVLTRLTVSLIAIDNTEVLFDIILPTPHF